MLVSKLEKFRRLLSEPNSFVVLSPPADTTRELDETRRFVDNRDERNELDSVRIASGAHQVHVLGKRLSGRKGAGKDVVELYRAFSRKRVVGEPWLEFQL